jgi:hypothetical protein
MWLVIAGRILTRFGTLKRTLNVTLLEMPNYPRVVRSILGRSIVVLWPTPEKRPRNGSYPSLWYNKAQPYFFYVVGCSA